MGDQSWADYIKESCIGSTCWAVGVAYTESGEIFEVAADDDNGWAHLYAEEHEEEIDGQRKKINETALLLGVLQTGKSADGVWLGQKKYHVMRTDTMPFKDDEEYQVTLFAKGKTGGVIVKGPTYSVIGLYDEEKEQTKNGCVGTVLEFCHAIRAM